MSCPRCQRDPHPANYGSPRRCAFAPSGDFTPKNWSCATIDALLSRDGTTEVEGDNESMQVVHADPDRDHGGFIVLTRYKHRGCTSSAVHVGDFWPPVPLTMETALRAIGDIPKESEGAN